MIHTDAIAKQKQRPNLAAIILSLGCSASGSAAATCYDDGHFIDAAGLLDIALHPSEADTLFAMQTPGDPDGLALLKSCNGGTSWSATALTADFYTVTSIAVDPLNPDDVYAATNRGVHTSSDGGVTWSESDLPGGQLQFAADGTFYVTDTNRIRRRLPGESTWTELTPVLSSFEVLRIDPVDPSRLHVGEYYSVDGGISWQRVFPARVPDIRFSASNPSNMIATAKPALLSYDGGVNWAQLPLEEFEVFNTADVDGTAVAIDADDPQILWVATRGCGLWRSVNGGARWSLPMTGITGSGNFCFLGDERAEIRRFHPSPADSDRFFVITSDGLFVSRDNGENWTMSNGEAGNPETPPPSPVSGDADLSLDLFGLPGSFTPPTTLSFSGTIRHNGPDIAREVTFSAAVDEITASVGSCSGGTCDFGDLAPGTVIQLQLRREVLGGGIGAQCNGDVFTISGGVSATTKDPNPGNNSDTVSTTRQNSGSIISGCPGEGLLQPVSEDGSGGGATSPLWLLLLTFAVRRIRNHK